MLQYIYVAMHDINVGIKGSCAPQFLLSLHRNVVFSIQMCPDKVIVPPMQFCMECLILTPPGEPREGGSLPWATEHTGAINILNMDPGPQILLLHQAPK